MISYTEKCPHHCYHHMDFSFKFYNITVSQRIVYNTIWKTRLGGCQFSFVGVYLGGLCCFKGVYVCFCVYKMFGWTCKCFIAIFSQINLQIQNIWGIPRRNIRWGCVFKLPYIQYIGVSTSPTWIKLKQE